MPRKRVKEQKKSRSRNRVDILLERIKNISDPEDIMMEIMEIFTDIEMVPEPGNYYTFLYNAKTPNILYDQHPLVAVTSVERWGFQGINFHWGKPKRYTWIEILSSLYGVENDEISTLRNINYAKFVNS